MQLLAEDHCRLHPDGHVHGFRIRPQLVNGGLHLTRAGWVGLRVDCIFDLIIHLMSSRSKAGLVMERVGWRKG